MPCRIQMYYIWHFHIGETSSPYGYCGKPSLDAELSLSVCVHQAILLNYFIRALGVRFELASKMSLFLCITVTFTAKHFSVCACLN